MKRPIIFALFGGRRSWLRYVPRVRRWLRGIYLQQRGWVLRLDDETILCRILGRLKLFVDPRDRGISPHVMMNGIWEHATTEVIVDLIDEGMVAVDVGANLGYFTVVMAALCGPRGRIISIEPNPVAARHLQESIALNGFRDRVDFHAVVLGDQDGDEVTLVLPRDNPGGAHVAPVVPPGAGHLTARTRRLDQIDGALDAVLVKIDAEGMEERILQGMDAMIAGERLRYILVEFSPNCYVDGPAMIDALLARGFRLFRIDEWRGIGPIARSALFDGTEQRMLLFQR